MKRLFSLFIALLTLSAGLAHAQGNREPDPLPTPENNQIVYRSSDHQKITLNNANEFGVAYNDANSVYYPEDDYGVVSFDGNITTIGDWAFTNRATLVAVAWPSTVTSIGQYAFNGCTNLNSVDLQEGVTSIGKSAFNGCAGQEELILPSTVTSIGDGAFYGWTALTKLTVKAGSIGYQAFQNCTNLSSIDLQESVTGIGEHAFDGCTNLSSINLPEGVTNIGDYAFQGCASMATLILPSTMTSIGQNAFSGCSTLTSVNIPASVTEIKGGAFLNCTNLASITFSNGATGIGGELLIGCTNLTLVKFLGYAVINPVTFMSIGTAESPVNLQLPSTWLSTDKPINSATPWHGGYFNCEYADPVKEFLGEMGEPCTDCPVVEIKKGDKTVRLYNPEKVEFKKQ